MKICCTFSYADASTAMKHFERETIMEFSDKVYNSDGTIKHYTYCWDAGGRKVVRCRKCGAIFLHQWSEFRDTTRNDAYYDDYFLVKGLDEAILLNEKYGGFSLESNFKGLKLWTSSDVWCWNK